MLPECTEPDCNKPAPVKHDGFVFCVLHYWQVSLLYVPERFRKPTTTTF